MAGNDRETTHTPGGVGAAGEQMTIILRRTTDGGWEISGAIGRPGVRHAREVTGSFRQADFAQASFLCGLAAGMLALGDAAREFGAMPMEDGA